MISFYTFTAVLRSLYSVYAWTQKLLHQFIKYRFFPFNQLSSFHLQLQYTAVLQNVRPLSIFPGNKAVSTLTVEKWQ